MEEARQHSSELSAEVQERAKWAAEAARAEVAAEAEAAKAELVRMVAHEQAQTAQRTPAKLQEAAGSQTLREAEGTGNALKADCGASASGASQRIPGAFLMPSWCNFCCTPRPFFVRS